MGNAACAKLAGCIALTDRSRGTALGKWPRTEAAHGDSGARTAAAVAQAIGVASGASQGPAAAQAEIVFGDGPAADSSGTRSSVMKRLP